MNGFKRSVACCCVRRGIPRVLISVTLGLAAFIACGEPTVPSSDNNQHPVLALRTPVIVPVGEAILVDASGTQDPDGDPLSYRFEFIGYVGESTNLATTQSAEKRVTFNFPAPGLYTLRFTAKDIHEATTTMLRDITARAEYPIPPDFCEEAADCIVGTECSQNICYLTDSSQ